LAGVTEQARTLWERETLRTLVLGDRLHLEAPSEPRVLAGVRQALRRWLAQRDDISHDTTYEITLACDEAVTNAIEHACNPGTPRFELRGVLSDGHVEVEVRDHGHWRAEREDDRGRGLGLMEALMDEVHVQPSAEGTTVRMRRRIASPAPAA
jgi:anti-sigma regulatory factor (Ser/Thr protein kinase)